MTTENNLQRWLANLAAAQAMMEKLPEEKLNLRSFRDPFGVEGESTNFSKPPECGTICCFGGWCAWEPASMALGVRAEPSLGCPELDFDVNASVSMFLFGDGEMFHARGGPDDRTDHEIVMDRIAGDTGDVLSADAIDDLCERINT
jgi:hypothetical protein